MGRHSVHGRAVPAFLALFQTSLRTRGLTSRLPQWCALAVIALVDAIWAWRSGFHIIVTFGDFALPAGIVALAVAFHLFRQGKAALMTEYLALTLSMALAFTVLAYLCLAASGPLADAQLLAADRALGFDWLAGFHFLERHPLLFWVMERLYVSLDFQALYLCLFLGLLGREGALREVFWIVFVAALMTDVTAIAMPAYGPFAVFGLSAHGGFLPDMMRVKSGHHLDFALAKMTGVISFPSFHTVMALAYAYAMRKTGLVGYLIAAVNFAMLFSIPFFGGHYLVDMIAGAAVVVLAAAIVKSVTMLASARGDFAPVLQSAS